MAKDLEELKPCPFCGGKPEIEPRFGAVSVDCKSCFAGAGPHDTEADAITAWNTRQAADQLERYRVALEWYADPVLPYAITQTSEPRSAVHSDKGERARQALEAK